MEEMQEIWVLSLGWKDPLEKEVAAHSSILVCEIPWTEEPDRLQSTGWQRAGHNTRMHAHTHTKPPSSLELSSHLSRIFGGLDSQTTVLACLQPLTGLPQ